MRTIRLLPVMLAIAGVTFTTSCRKGAEAGPKPGTANYGRMSVKMTDAPGDYAALNVEITKVEVYSSNGEWTTLSNQVKQVNVISLTNGAETSLAANVSLKAGFYSKVKLTFGDNYSLKLNSGASYSGTTLTADGEAQIAWGGPKEVIIAISEEVQASAHSEILLDFEVTESLTDFGEQYVLFPVIEFVDDVKTGIKGQVSAAAHAAVVVSNGIVSFSSYLDAQGNFLIRDLDEGSWKAIVFPTPEQVKNGLPKEYKIENIIVSEGQIKNIGTISL